MSTYKLIYLDARGRGEVIRLIFAQAEQDYEDKRIPFEDVIAERQKSPYGILPVLHIDNSTVLSGNGTIARYLAEKYGLAGTNDIENAELYGIIDATETLWLQIIAYFYESDEATKKVIGKKLMEMWLPAALGKFEKQIETNNSPEGWIYGTKMTYADFAMFALVDVLNDQLSEMVTKYPHLLKLYETVKSQPNIAKWLASRPTTSH